jgi:hypothetical protein
MAASGTGAAAVDAGDWVPQQRIGRCLQNVLESFRRGPGWSFVALPLCATSILNERLTHIDGGVSRVSLTSMAVSPVQPRATDPLACDGEAHASMLDCRTVLSSGIKMRVTLGGEKASGCDYFGVIMISTAASGPRRS